MEIALGSTETRPSRPIARCAVAAAALAIVLAALIAGLFPAHPDAAAPAARVSHSVPLAVRGQISATLGREERGYEVRGLSASNPAQSFRTTFSSAGATIAAGRGRLTLGLAAYGPAGSLRAVAPAAPRVSANRVSYSRRNLSEWYVNGPLGLEQGFDIDRPPAGARGPIALAVRIGGNMSVHLEHGSLVLRATGATLHYGQLIATDARGHVLPASLGLNGRRALITVNARGAVYPLHIDPLTNSEAELKAGDAAKNDQFGLAVAIAGKTLVVGADYHEEAHGAAYVFTTTSSWSAAKQVAELKASSEGFFFGESVAISQNEATIVVGGADTAYVFAEPGGGWAASAQQTETRALKGEGETSHLAETSVATGAEGKTIVLGVPGQIVNEHTEKAAVNQGAVFIYSEPSGGWKEAPAAPARITTADGKTQDEFGTAVAISASESTIAAGAPYTFEGESRTAETGRAYILTRPADGWTDLASIGVVEFKPKSSMFTEGAHFGSAAAISETGATVAIGAPGYSFNEGAGYVFVEPAGGWKPGSAIGTAIVAGGSSIAISADGKRVLTGDQNYGAEGGPYDGRLFVYGEPSGGWSGREPVGAETSNPTGASEAGYIGASAGISGSTIVAGAPGEAENAGRSYVFPLPAFSPPAPETSEEVIEEPGTGSEKEKVVKQETPKTTTGTGTTVQQLVIKPIAKESEAEYRKKWVELVLRETERFLEEATNGKNILQVLLNNGGSLGIQSQSPTPGTVSLNGTGSVSEKPVKVSTASSHRAALLFTGVAHLKTGVKPRLKIKLTRAGHIALQEVTKHHRLLSLTVKIVYAVPGHATTHGSLRLTIRPPKAKRKRG